MQQFEIILRNEKTKFYDRFAVLLFILSGVGLSIAFYRSNLQIISMNAGPVWLFIAVTFTILLVIMVIQQKVFQHFYKFLIACAAITLFWVLLNYWWIGLITVMLIALYIISKKELKVIVTANKISYPSLPKKSIAWDDLSNVILKDRLLTIDFKNNKFIQHYIDAKSYSINEQNFNEFCRQQLNQ